MVDAYSPPPCQVCQVVRERNISNHLFISRWPLMTSHLLTVVCLFQQSHGLCQAVTTYKRELISTLEVIHTVMTTSARATLRVYIKKEGYFFSRSLTSASSGQYILLCEVFNSPWDKGPPPRRHAQAVPSQCHPHRVAPQLDPRAAYSVPWPHRVVLVYFFSAPVSTTMRQSFSSTVHLTWTVGAAAQRQITLHGSLHPAPPLFALARLKRQCRQLRSSHNAHNSHSMAGRQS